MALGTFSIQIMTGGTFKGTRTVKISLFFVKPLLAFGMGVTVMAICRSIAVISIQFVALDTDSVRPGQAEFFMGNGAVLPINSIWDLAARRAKMTGRTLGFQIMAQGAIELTLAMIPHLCSIKPGLTQGMI